MPTFMLPAARKGSQATEAPHALHKCQYNLVTAEASTLVRPRLDKTFPDQHLPGVSSLRQHQTHKRPTVWSSTFPPLFINCRLSTAAAALPVSYSQYLMPHLAELSGCKSLHESYEGPIARFVAVAYHNLERMRGSQRVRQ